MPIYAQLHQGRVRALAETAVAIEDDPTMIEIEAMDASLLGRLYDEEEQEFIDDAEQPRHITTLAFLSRFTDAEAIAIDLASIGATQQAAALRRYKEKVSAARYIDLERTDTRAGVQALEAFGLLAEGRADEILDAEIVASERP